MALERDGVKRSLAVYKGWVTKYSTRLSEVLAADPSTIELTDAINQFETKLSKYEDCMQEYLSLIPLEEIDTTIQDSEEYMHNARKPLLEARKKLQPQDVSNQNAPSAASAVSESRQTSIRLPKIELPRYSGDYTEWLTFWQHFSSHGHTNEEIPIISKFTYLIGLLDGEAKEVIKGYAHTEANYQLAVNSLKDRYGREEKIILPGIRKKYTGFYPHLNI